MFNNKEKGVLGEKLVTKLLLDKGYLLLAENKRIGRIEFDIILAKKNKLFVVEVKTRTSKIYGEPEEAVTEKKLNNFSNCYYDLVKEYGYENIVYVVASVFIDQTTKQTKIKFFKFN